MKLHQRQAWRSLLLLASILRLASPATANISYLVLAGYALRGRAQAIEALALSWLFTMFNPGLAPSGHGPSSGRYAVLAAAALSVVLRNLFSAKELRISRPVAATLGLGCFIVLHGLMFSRMPGVSILKGLSWLLASSTLLTAWMGLGQAARARLERSIFGGLTFLVLASFPLVVTSVGYLRNGVGFQGLLNHPNAFGPACALLGAWIAGHVIKQPHTQWRQFITLSVCAISILLSQARTAGLSLMLGVTTAVIFTPLLAGRRATVTMPGLRNPKFQVFGFVAIAAFLFFSPSLTPRLEHYMYKRSHAQNLAQAAERSRGGFVDTMWSNILDHPLEGIGFGIASNPGSMVVHRDPWLGIPNGAPVEKGIMPMAVLEELGAFGFLAAALWLFLLVHRSAGGGFPELAVLATVLLTNLGESTLFSPGGNGLLALLLLSWAATASAKRVPLRIANA